MHKNCLFWPLCPAPNTQSLADRKKMFLDTYKNIYSAVFPCRENKQEEEKKNIKKPRTTNSINEYQTFYGPMADMIILETTLKASVLSFLFVGSRHFISFLGQSVGHHEFGLNKYSFGYGCSKISIGLVQKKLIHSWTSSHSIGGSLWSFLLLLVNNCYS